MKNKISKILVASAVFAVGASLAIGHLTKPEPIYATQHADNYADYTYSGTYYSSVTGDLTGGLQGTLRKKLSSLILPKAWYTYSGSSNGTLGKILQDSDQDPTNSSNMVLFYTRDSITKRGSGGSTTDWNREHVWPQSLSNDHWGKEKAGADLLHIRPTWYTTNNARGNTRYGDNGKKGVQKYEGMDYAYTSGGYFEPLDSVKGDVARILMYVWTAYYEYYNDSSLVITKAIESYDVLLKWHTMDKPDALEGRRNDYSQSSNQKNRNPFVDHPEYAWQIFGDNVSASVKQACKDAYPADEPQSGGTSSSEPTTSSEPIVTSEESSLPPYEPSVDEQSSEAAPSSSNNNESKKGKVGCMGSIVGIVSATGVSALVGLVFVFSKKKEE